MERPLSIDDDANETFYGKPDILASDIISGKVRSNDDSARRFMTAVNTSTGATAANTTTASAPVSQTGQRSTERRTGTQAVGSAAYWRAVVPDGRSKSGQRASVGSSRQTRGFPLARRGVAKNLRRTRGHVT